MKELVIHHTNRVFKCDVKNESRERKFVYARIALSHYLRHNLKMTLADIGIVIGKIHCTIIHYLKEHDQLYKYDSDYREKYDKLKSLSNTKRWLCNWCVYPIINKRDL